MTDLGDITLRLYVNNEEVVRPSFVLVQLSKAMNSSIHCWTDTTHPPFTPITPQAAANTVLTTKRAVNIETAEVCVFGPPPLLLSENSETKYSSLRII